MSLMTARLCALTRVTPGLAQVYSWHGTGTPLLSTDIGLGPSIVSLYTRQVAL